MARHLEEIDAPKTSLKKKLISKIAKPNINQDAYVESNDNIWINNGRNKNSHLEYRGSRGAKDHALWDKEHPNIAKWRDIATAVPFAVASAPLASGIGIGGNAIAATKVGKNITSGLNFLSKAASNTKLATGTKSLTGVGLGNWFNSLLTSGFGAHGVDKSIKEKAISPETVLEVAPVGQVVNPITKSLVPYSRLLQKQVNAAKRIERLQRLNRGLQLTDYKKYNDINNDVAKLSETLGTINRRFDFTEAPDLTRVPKFVKGELKTSTKQQGKNTTVSELLREPVSKENIENFIGKHIMYAPEGKEAMKSLEIDGVNRDIFFTKQREAGFNPTKLIHGDPVVKTGKIHLDDAETGLAQSFYLDPKSVTPNTGYSKYKYPEAIIPVEHSTNSTPLYPEVPKEFADALQKNIDYVTQKALPGSKVFGSSVNVAKGNLYHGTDDIDLIMTQNQIKNHPSFKQFVAKVTNPKNSDDVITYKWQHPTAGDLDINVLAQDKNGMAIGDRAHELYAQLYPKEYAAIMKKIASTSSDKLLDLSKIPLNKTPEQLLESYDPITKSIADAFGSGKSKHMRRASYYLHYGKTDDVEKGFNMFANYVTGGEYKPSGIPLEVFNSPTKNKEIIKELGLKHINPEQFVDDPKRMKLLYEYAYFHKNMLNRGVDSYRNPNAIKGLTYWYPDTDGGTAYGVGLNTVQGGNSEYGDIYGTLIPKEIASRPYIEDPIKALKYSDTMLGEKVLTPTELKTLKDIGKKHNINLENVNSLADALESTSNKRGQNYKDWLQEVASNFGISGIKSNMSFGPQPYVSLRDLHPDEVKQIIPRGLDRPVSLEARDDANHVVNAGEINVEKLFNAFRNPVSRKSTIKKSFDARNDIYKDGQQKFTYLGDRLLSKRSNLIKQRQAFEDDFFDKQLKRRQKLNRLEYKVWLRDEIVKKGLKSSSIGIPLGLAASYGYDRIKKQNEERDKILKAYKAKQKLKLNRTKLNK